MHHVETQFVGWVQNRDKNRFRLAVGSFIEDHNNYVEIIERAIPFFFSSPHSPINTCIMSLRSTCLDTPCSSRRPDN